MAKGTAAQQTSVVGKRSLATHAQRTAEAGACVCEYGEARAGERGAVGDDAHAVVAAPERLRLEQHEQLLPPTTVRLRCQTQAHRDTRADTPVTRGEGRR